MIDSFYILLKGEVNLTAPEIINQEESSEQSEREEDEIIDEKIVNQINQNTSFLTSTTAGR